MRRPAQEEPLSGGISPDPEEARLRVARIRVYPLKGAGGFDLEEAHLDAFGLLGDRRWMLVRPNGLFISQRTHPKLALIRVTPLPGASSGGAPPGTVLFDEGQGVRGSSVARGGLAPMSFGVTAPGMEPFVLCQAGGGDPEMLVRVQADEVIGRVISDGSAWFSRVLQEDCRLVFAPSSFLRAVDPAFAPGHRIGFSDGYPLLLATRESLEDLNRRLSRPSSMLRFRPNLVVEGGKPWEEDQWRVLNVGRIRLALVKPCARCSVTTVDPGSGSRGKEPLRTLATFRKWEGKIWFGQNAVHSETGTFRAGDPVHIVEKGQPRPPL